MTTQPKALRLADELEQSPGYDFNKMYCEAASELRRLYAKSEKLFELLEYLETSVYKTDGEKP
jgi:hypothetical protein